MRPRTVRGFLAAVSIAALAGCATPPPPARQASVLPHPSGPPAAYVDVGLAAQAGAFEAYTRRAAAIDPGFANRGEVNDALTTAAGYEPRQLEESLVAYAAMAALQEPGFVAGVRAQGHDLARRLAADPDAALALPAGRSAAARADAALARRGEALADAGRRVKQAAYTVQRQAWSRGRISDGPQRLAAVKRAAGYRPEPADRARLAAAVAEGGHRTGASSAAARGVAVAALTVLGDDRTARSLMRDPGAGECLHLAKLNYHQCLAAAGTPYEDVYCLGVHAMSDPGRCVIAAAEPARSRRASLD